MPVHLPVALYQHGKARLALIFRQQVDLVGDQPAWLGQQAGVVFAEFFEDGMSVMHRVGIGIEGGDVDDVQQQAGALQVAQELVAKAGALRRALDEAGNVGDDEAAVGVHAHHAEVGMQGGEGVVGDLRPCRGYGADEGGFPGVWQAEQPDIGQHPELHLEFAPLARCARRALLGGAVGAGLEMNVAEAALATLGNERLLAVMIEVGQHLAGFEVADDGADGHAQDHVLAAASVAVRAHAVFAALGAEDARVAEIDERVEVAVGNGPDAAAAPAVTA